VWIAPPEAPARQCLGTAGGGKHIGVVIRTVSFFVLKFIDREF